MVKQIPPETADEQGGKCNALNQRKYNAFTEPGGTKVIPNDKLFDLNDPPEKQDAIGNGFTDGLGENVNVWIKGKYGFPESGGAKIIPDDELLNTKTPPEEPNANGNDFTDFKDIQKSRKINSSLHKLECHKSEEQIVEHGNETYVGTLQDRFVELESQDNKPYETIHVNDLFRLDIKENLEKQSGISIEKESKISVRVKNKTHLMELIRTKHVGHLSHFRVKRRHLGLTYHHHYLTLDANNENMTILHLTNDSHYDMVCKREVIDFSKKCHCKDFLNFDAGVELLHRYEIPTNETDLEAIQDRIKEVCGLHYIDYSLTSPEKMYCESLVSYVLTGEKDCAEVGEFIKRYGKRAKVIIFGVNKFCSLKSRVRRIYCS